MNKEEFQSELKKRFVLNRKHGTWESFKLDTFNEGDKWWLNKFELIIKLASELHEEKFQKQSEDYQDEIERLCE